MSSLGFTGIAAGDIYPARFVKQSGQPFEVAQAGANDALFGISQLGTNTPPIPGVTSDKAAVAGGSLRVHKPGERCFVTAGGTITAGDRLKSDADGKGVAIATSGTTPQRYGAIALQNAASGEFCEVEVAIGVESPA